MPRYGELYAEYIVDGLKAQKIGILSGREEYPKNEGDALTKQLQKWYGIAPVKRAEFNIGDKDFTPQLLDLQQANPQVIAFFGIRRRPPLRCARRRSSASISRSSSAPPWSIKAS